MAALTFSAYIHIISNSCLEKKGEVKFFHWINGNYNLQHGPKY